MGIITKDDYLSGKCFNGAVSVDPAPSNFKSYSKSPSVSGKYLVKLKEYIHVLVRHQCHSKEFPPGRTPGA